MNNSDTSFKGEIMFFCKLHSINVTEEYVQYLHPAQAHQISECLYSLFDGLGFEDTLETGMPPSDFLPSLIEHLLALIEPENAWRVENVSSVDNWDSADIELKSSTGETYRFRVKGVDDSDWVPVDLFDKINGFAKKYAKYSLAVFFSDDPYRVIPFTHDAFNELESIIERHTEAYD
jgi:hypothetical protein